MERKKYFVIRRNEEVIKFTFRSDAYREYLSEKMRLGKEEKVTIICEAPKIEDSFKQTSYGVSSFLEERNKIQEYDGMMIEKFYINAKHKENTGQGTDFLRSFIKEYEDNLIETGPKYYKDYSSYFTHREGN